MLWLIETTDSTTGSSSFKDSYEFAVDNREALYK